MEDAKDSELGQEMQALLETLTSIYALASQSAVERLAPKAQTELCAALEAGSAGLRFTVDVTLGQGMTVLCSVTGKEKLSNLFDIRGRFCDGGLFLAKKDS